MIIIGISFEERNCQILNFTLINAKPQTPNAKPWRLREILIAKKYPQKGTIKIPKSGKRFLLSEIRSSPKLTSMFPLLRKYFTERNALTVVVSFFCLSMTILSAVNQQLWQTIAFALAFSFSVEVICHRAKEK